MRQGEHGNETRENMGTRQENMGMRLGRAWERDKGEHRNETRENMETRRRKPWQRDEARKRTGSTKSDDRHPPCDIIRFLHLDTKVLVGTLGFLRGQG